MLFLTTVVPELVERATEKRSMKWPARVFTMQKPHDLGNIRLAFITFKNTFFMLSSFRGLASYNWRE
jgi:hypothetical protein